MKVAVTGASGFIGRHVLRELDRRQGVAVIATARAPLSHDTPGHITQVQLDISTAIAADAYEQLGKPDVLIHLAWAGLPNYKALNHFEEHLSTQYRFLSGLIRSGLPSLLCTGTCFEYGMRAGAMAEDEATDPTNPYGFAKDALHRQLRFLQAEKSFSLTWARLFYMYGAGQPRSSLFKQFISAGERGDAAFPMSGGEQLRDFLPVERIANLIVRLALDAPNAGAINVCSGKPVSVRSLVEGWKRTRNWSIDLDLGRYPYADYEPMAFWGSATLLDRLLSLPDQPIR